MGERERARESEREPAKHKQLSRERWGRAVCQRWKGACDVLVVISVRLNWGGSTATAGFGGRGWRVGVQGSGCVDLGLKV